jgi:hypothetical protein
LAISRIFAATWSTPLAIILGAAMLFGSYLSATA